MHTSYTPDEPTLRCFTQTLRQSKGKSRGVAGDRLSRSLEAERC